jgi:hypothetical protein
MSGHWLLGSGRSSSEPALRFCKSCGTLLATMSDFCPSCHALEQHRQREQAEEAQTRKLRAERDTEHSRWVAATNQGLKHVQELVGGLQEAGRLPRGIDLYHPLLDLVRANLQRGDADGALKACALIADDNELASYPAYELVKFVCSEQGKLSVALEAGRHAAAMLTYH